jgi:homocitrate synthase NifV
MEIEFKNDQDARKILELVRYANVHNQKPLVQDELRFIAKVSRYRQRTPDHGNT